jgi:ATP-dependent Lhr-like helicase
MPSGRLVRAAGGCRVLIPYGGDVLVFPWTGSRRLQTLSLAFVAREFKSAHFGHAIEVDNCAVAGVKSYLKELADGDVPDGEKPPGWQSRT